MRIVNSILLICLLVGLSVCHSEFDKYLDPWNSIATIEGEFETNHTVNIDSN